MTPEQELGTWEPATLDARVDRLESLAAIRQLPPRYALALDSRDIAMLVTLFVPDVRVGATATGREALREWFTDAMTKVRTSVHVVANHIIDFDANDRAHGIVYCRDEVECPDTGEWKVGMLQYHDTYRRTDGAWAFERRRFYRWYQTDALTRPAPGAGMEPDVDPITTNRLPESFSTWAPFWDSVAVR
ncbi:MAG TPA: nuclear transport factor 2 family protein [Acidimicrobiia bacterium]|jgi:hypothetical protein